MEKFESISFKDEDIFENRYKKIKSACFYAGVSISTFQRWIENGYIDLIKIDGNTLFDKEDIDKFLEKNKMNKK